MTHRRARWSAMKPLQLFGWCWMIAALTVLLPLPARAEPVQQIIAMRAADGRVVPALVTYPEGGPESGSPVAIIVHGGPGGHPLRALGAARWAATYFADHGYITISVLTRISRDVIDQPFGAAVADIKGAVDWASQLSDGPIVLIGHSSGSVTSSMYMATTNDPRVKAIVHFAPTAWGSGWMIRSMGQARYAAVVARLNKLVAQGRGDEPVYEDHQLAPPAPQTVTYGYLMNARTWLSWWGPNSKNRNIALFPKIRVPMLMISGDRDIFVSRAYQEELRLAATASPRVDSIILDGGIPHEFTGAEVKASTLAYDWLIGIGIGPQLRIETRVVDLKFGSDVRPGVIYQPVDPARRKPLAVILMADFADDVLVSPFTAIAPRLARAGYTVLTAQDRGSGWPFHRAVAAGVSADQRAWLGYLRAQTHGEVVVIAHGMAGAMIPPLDAGVTQPGVAAAVLIEPPVAPSQFAASVLGAAAYRKAVAEAEAAVKADKGGTVMIVAPYRSNGKTEASRHWISHMAQGFLSFWGPEAPPAPVPLLQGGGRPLLLIGSGSGRFMNRAAQSAFAQTKGTTSLWYDGTATPFAVPDRLVADLVSWLNDLPQNAQRTMPDAK